MRGHDIMNETVKAIVETLNEEFEQLVVADVTPKGNIQISSRSRRYMDCYELEEMLSGILEYVVDKHNVDFNVINYHKNGLIVEVFTYEK